MVFFGTKDKLVSVKTAEAYKAKMIEMGNRCELFFYEGQAHGFFNNGEWFDKTLRETDIFLRSLGYIEGKPTFLKKHGNKKTFIYLANDACDAGSTRAVFLTGFSTGKN